MADLYYIEEGYYDAGYFVYTADAAAAVTSTSSIQAVVGKNQSIDLVSFSFATLSATAGKIHPGASTQSSSSSITASVSKIVDVNDAYPYTWDSLTAWENFVTNEWRPSGIIVVSAFTLTGNLTIVTGVDVFATGSFTSQSSVSTTVLRLAGLSSTLVSQVNQSTTVVKTVNVFSTMSSAFTQTAIISHIEGADLFAFTNAAIAIQVDRIRGNNIAASEVFNVATDVIRIRQGDADADAIFSAIINGLRSRDVNLTTQAAFSFAATISHIEGADIQTTNFVSLSATITRTRDNSSSINAQATLSAEALKVKALQAAISSQSTVSVSVSLIKGITQNLSSAFTQTGVISHIHGADITAFTNAALSASAVAFKGIIQNIACQVSVSATLTGNYKAGATISLVARINAAAAVLLRNISIVQNSGGDFTNIDWTTEASKFGGGSLKISPYTGSVNHHNSQASINNGTDLKYFTNGYTYVSTNATTWVRYSNNLAVNPTKVIWTGTQYACRNATAIYTSSDGVSWTTTNITSPIASTFTPIGDTIEYLGGYWYIGTQASNGVAIHRSNNLSTWTNVGPNLQSSGYIGAERRWVGSVNTGSQIFFAAMIKESTALAVTYSSNGTTWNFTTMPTVGVNTGGTIISGLSYGNGFLMLTGWRYSPSYKFYLHSMPVSTLSSWTLRRTNTDYEYLKVAYVGSSWFYYQYDYNWYAGDIDTMTPVLKTSPYTSNQSFPGFISGKYVFAKDNGIQYSTSATSGYQFQTTSVNSGLAGTISYSDAGNDLSNWQTLDFWVNGSGNLGQPLFNQEGASWRMYGGILNSYFSVYFQGLGNNDTRYNIYHTGSPGGNLYVGGWNHIRISRNSSTGAVAVFCNGTKVTSVVPNTGTFPEANNAPIIFGGAPYIESSAYFDEFLVSDQLITNTTATSFTVPTGQWSSDANTDLLLHFNYSVTDDSRFQVVPTASISSVATISARLTGTQKASASLQSTATINVIVSGVVGANLVAFSNAALTTTANRIRDTAVTCVVSSTVIANNARTRASNSSLSSVFTSSTNNDRLRDTSIAAQSAFAQTSIINKIGNGVVNVSSQVSVTAYITRIQEILLLAFNNASLSAVGNVIRSAISNQSSAVTVSTIGVKTVRGASQQAAESSVSTIAVLTRSVIIITQAIASEVAVVVATKISLADLVVSFTLSAVANANTKQGASSLSSSATLSASAVKTAGATSSLLSQVNQASTVSKTTGYSSALLSVATVYVLANALGKIELYAFANASINVVVTITRTTSVSISSQATFVANTFDSLAKQAAAVLTLVATQSTVAVKRVNPTFTFISIASELAVVVKAASGAITLSSAFTVNTIVAVSRGTGAVFNSAATTVTVGTRTARVSSAISSQSTLISTITRIRSANITTQAIASTLTAISRIAKFFINCNVASTLTVSAKVIRGARSSLTSIATFTSLNVKLVSTTAAITSRASVSATIGVRKRFSAAFTSAMTFVVDARDLRLDEIVYVIPGENYVYTITSESRIHDIYGETRIRSVTGESRIRTIQGESRIHTT